MYPVIVKKWLAMDQFLIHPTEVKLLLTASAGSRAIFLSNE